MQTKRGSVTRSNVKLPQDFESFNRPHLARKAFGWTPLWNRHARKYAAVKFTPTGVWALLRVTDPRSLVAKRHRKLARHASVWLMFWSITSWKDDGTPRLPKNSKSDVHCEKCLWSIPSSLRDATGWRLYQTLACLA